jgi:hypothetical protein
VGGKVLVLEAVTFIQNIYRNQKYFIIYLSSFNNIMYFNVRWRGKVESRK